MLTHEKYMNILKESKEPMTILQWANKLIKKYPFILKQIDKRTQRPITLQTLVSSLSIKVSKGEFPNLKVLEHKPYRKVIYLSDFKKNEFIKKAVQEDILAMTIEEKIQQDRRKVTEYEKYRLEEFQRIMEQLNKYFSLNFVLHHVVSLNNPKKQGRHHASNLQILTLEHSLLKQESDKRFSIEEQKVYIKRIIVIAMMVDNRIDLDLIDEVLEMLVDRLEKIY